VDEDVGVSERIHVLPVNDLRDHVESETCWCNPQTDELGVVVHNALDQRELYERGERKPS